MKLDKYKILFNRQDSTASGKYCSTDNVVNWNRKKISMNMMMLRRIMILLHSAGHPPLSAKSSSSNLNDSASHGSRVKAKKSRGVGISAEPQTLQNLQVRYLILWYYIIELGYFEVKSGSSYKNILFLPGHFQCKIC